MTAIDGSNNTQPPRYNADLDQFKTKTQTPYQADRIVAHVIHDLTPLINKIIVVWKKNLGRTDEIRKLLLIIPCVSIYFLHSLVFLVFIHCLRTCSPWSTRDARAICQIHSFVPFAIFIHLCYLPYSIICASRQIYSFVTFTEFIHLCHLPNPFICAISQSQLSTVIFA